MGIPCNTETKVCIIHAAKVKSFTFTIDKCQGSTIQSIPITISMSHEPAFSVTTTSHPFIVEKNSKYPVLC